MLKRIGYWILFLLIFAAPWAQAQELITNGDFDTDISDWNILFGRSAVWDSRDSAAAGSSGSVLLTYEGMGNGSTQLILAQCVPVNVSQEYRFGAQVLFPPGQGDDSGAARIFIDSYENNACTGASSSFISDTGSPGPSDDWIPIGGIYVAQPGIQSVRISLGIMKTQGVSSDSVALFDAVTFGSFRFATRTIEGIWVNPSETSGQGLMFDYGASFAQTFMAWLTDFLDTVDPDNPQGRRLLTALMLVDGNRFMGTLRVNEDNGMGGQTSRELGAIEIEMSACDAGQVRIDLIDPPQSISFDILPLEQQVNPDDYICETME